MNRLRRLQAALPALFHAVAGVVLSSMLLALAMAASEELHHQLHSDADHEEHDCAVTHLMSGTFGDGAGLPMLVIELLPVLIEGGEPRQGERRVQPLHLDDGVLEHAPPVLDCGITR
jgi:hypothetical protein